MKTKEEVINYLCDLLFHRYMNGSMFPTLPEIIPLSWALYMKPEDLRRQVDKFYPEYIKQIEKSKENQSIHKDIISRIERMEKVLDAQSKQEFLQDLAAKRLGFSVTFEQAQIIMKSTESIKEAHSKLTDTVPEYGADGKLHPLRYDFGLKTALLDKYITSVKESGMKKMSVGEWILSPDRWVKELTG